MGFYPPAALPEKYACSIRHNNVGKEPKKPPKKPLNNRPQTAHQPFETGGTSRPRPKSPTVDPSSRRPRNFRTIALNDSSPTSLDYARRLPPATAASFCEAGQRCQGRCIAHEVRADSQADGLRKNRRLFLKIFSANGAGIVETSLKWCADGRWLKSSDLKKPLVLPRDAFSPRRKFLCRLRQGPWIMAATGGSRDKRTTAR